MQTVELKGIITPILTPMNEDESVNIEELRNQIERLIEGGVHGLFPFGTNGEGYILSYDEKLEILKATIDQVNGRVPVYAGTGCISTRETIKLSKAAQELGADVLSIITPSFALASQKEIYDHYVAVAKEVDLPIVLYNIPARTGNKILPETVEKLARDVENIVGAKDSSGDWDNLKEYIHRTKNLEKPFYILSGNDALILPALKEGGTGGIAGCSNVYPAVLSSIYNLFVEGKLDEAQAAKVSANVDLVKFAIVNLILSLGFLAWCLLSYKILPDHPISQADGASVQDTESGKGLTKKQEMVTYLSFALAVAGMVSQSYIGDAGYALTGIAVIPIFLVGVLDFTEIRNAISAPIIIMSAGVIGVADALGSTGLTELVGKSVAGMLSSNINPFILIFAFCVLTSLLATLTGSTIGTVYVFAPLAIATCVQLGFNPTAAATAIVISGWCGHFLPVDGMPALIMGTGNYSIVEFWKFTVPQYFIRLLALTAGSLLLFPV